MFFKDIIGHSDVKKSLISFLETKSVSHAYIFEGEEGIGKKKLAMAFATGILCSDFNEDSCGKCKSCHLTNNDAHPDLKVLDLTVGEDGKKKASISVESIRQLKSDIYLKPFYGGRKVYILENADKMTVEAQNAMLKIFEEPPSYITIILICSKLSLVLPTIKSRAVIVKFGVLKPEELEKYLDLYYNDTENKKIYANVSYGSVKNMLELIEDPDSLLFRKDVLLSFNKILESKVQISYNDLFAIFMKNKENKEEIINMLLIYMMDIAYVKSNNEDRTVNIDFIESIKKIAPKITLTSIYDIENSLFNLTKKLKGNVNYKLGVLNTLLEIWEEVHG